VNFLLGGPLDSYVGGRGRYLVQLLEPKDKDETKNNITFLGCIHM
jgi:hypothetical protein